MPFFSNSEIESRINTTPRAGEMFSSLKGFEGPNCRIDDYPGYDKANLQGSILVTKNLSPRLVPMFGLSSGCISQNGGVLSHAAIVAQEMNFPVLVGVNINDPRFSDLKHLCVSPTGKIHV